MVPLLHDGLFVFMVLLVNSHVEDYLCQLCSHYVQNAQNHILSSTTYSANTYLYHRINIPAGEKEEPFLRELLDLIILLLWSSVKD